MAQFKAVAFDIDGTLYPNYRMYRASLGFALRNFSHLNAFRKVRREIRNIRPVDDFYGIQAQLFGAHFGLNEADAREIIQREFYTNWEKVLHRVRLFDGVLETIELIKSKGLPLGVLSDFPVITKMKVLELENYFDVELSAEEVGYLKPNPEPFLELCTRLGVPPEHTLYVGNSYKYDIVGAKDLGMAAAHLSGRREAHSRADFTFSRYSQLITWLQDKL